jgi:hypothetical protein
VVAGFLTFVFFASISQELCDGNDDIIIYIIFVIYMIIKSVPKMIKNI